MVWNFLHEIRQILLQKGVHLNSQLVIHMQIFVNLNIFLIKTKLDYAMQESHLKT